MDHPRRYNVERSCLRCHQRKVRCDRNSPCASCVRLNVSCQYPGPTRVKRSPPKVTLADVLSRLEQLERAVAELTQSNATPGTEQSERDTSPSMTASDQQTQRGLLVRDGQYIDEHLLSRFLEKDKELQCVIGTSRTDPNSSGRSFKVEGLIANSLRTPMDFQTLQPSRWQATQLWQTFLGRVDPLVKVLHIPSTQPRVFAAINQPQGVPADAHALLFAIYFAATTTLLSDNPLQDEIRADLRRYQQGFELALHRSSFLDSPTLTSLQATVIYQTCLRYHNSGRSSWTLYGLTIRAAQSIGLHRDGRHFNLPPLECELRRRLWWHISSFDHRAAEDHGLSLTAHNESCDTCLPANLDDQDLSATATVPPAPQPRWTDMSSPLITIEINRQWYEINRNAARGISPDPLVQDLKDHLHRSYLQYGDPNIPIHRHGLLLAEALTTKVAVYARQKACQSQGQAQDVATAQETLGMAVHALERGLEGQTDELLRGFRWLNATYTQYHLLTYILWQLCVYPTGVHVDRAWRLVETIVELVENDPGWPDPGPKWVMVSRLREKALKAREAVLADSQGEVTVSGSEMGFDWANWDLELMGFADWMA